MDTHLQFAKKLGDLLKKSENIQLLIIEGSVALGFEDNLSDIDLIAFCKKVPKKEEISKLLDLKEINLKSRYPGYQMHFNLEFQGSINFVEMPCLSEKVKHYPKVSLNQYQDLVRFLLRSKLIFDKTSKFIKYKDKCSKFPVNLRQEVISNSYSNLNYFFNEGALLNCAKRKDYIQVNQLFASQTKNLLSLIYALNGILLVHMKWAYKNLDQLKLKPKNFSDKINEVVCKGNSDKEIIEKARIFQDFLRWIKPLI